MPEATNTVGDDPPSALPLHDVKLSDKPLPNRAAREIDGVSATDFHHYARRAVREAGLETGASECGPKFVGFTNTDRRGLSGCVSGERRLATAPEATARQLRLALGILATGLVVLVVLAFVGARTFGTGGIALGGVVAAPVLAFGLFRATGTRSFDSEVLCLAYEGPTPAGVGQAIYHAPMSLKVTVSSGRVESYNLRTANSKSPGFTGRLVRRVVDAGPPDLAQLTAKVAQAVPPGSQILKAQDSTDDDPFG
ncbi:MAG TPA: hypothetical protein VJQ43_00640 [Thermoplasmata archaeon]|nr:hypothetical protein [Thermoplasmata archaeon]